jgi:hypothetical protein
VSLETLTIKDTCAGETYGLTKNWSTKCIHLCKILINEVIVKK